MPIQWLKPWEPVDVRECPDYCRGREAQLAREVGPRHILFGQQANLIGRRFDTDDALFGLSDGRVADVHLTWRSGAEPDPRWPAASIFPSIDAWANESMTLDHADWLERQVE